MRFGAGRGERSSVRLKLHAIAIGICCAWQVMAAAPARAAESRPAAASGVLDPVVVTARRRTEDLQAVPVAASVIGRELLEDSGTVNTQQLALLVPSLYYNSANPRNTAYTIRGLGSNTLSVSAANDGIEPGVGFYVDEVYHGRPAMAAFDFTDIERIEVMRGPQGTLFGKNTTGGAIQIISRMPTFMPEADGEIAVGGHDFMQAKMGFSGPLTDTVAGRLAAQVTQRDGLLRNADTGARLNDVNNLAVRGQLLYLPRDGLRIRLIADVADLDAACCTQNYLRVGTSLRSPSRQFPALAAGLGYAPPSLDIHDRLTDIDAPLRVQTQDGGISLNVGRDLAAAELTSITAWRYWDWDVANDRDYTGIPIQMVQRIPSRQDQYSQELRMASTGSARLGYVAGLYFFRQDIRGTPTSIYGPMAAYWLLNPANFSVPIPDDLLDGYGQRGASRFTMESHAAFGELNLEFTPRLSGTLGLRYTHEDKRGSYATEVSGGPDLSGLPAQTASELTRARLSIFRPQSYDPRDAGGSLSGRANLAFQWHEGLFGYVSYARGFKSGGLNMSGLPLDAQNQPALATAVIKDERNRTVELGLKSTLAEGRVTANLAAFHTVVRDYQANIVSSQETASIRSYPANIPAVRVRGMEGDLTALLFRGLTLRASVAYADGVNTDYPAGPCPLELQSGATVACDLTGVRLAGLSRWSGLLGLDLRAPAGRGEVTFHADWGMRSGYNSETAASRYTRIGGHGVVNASVGYGLAAGWEVQLFARNLLDKEYLTALTIQTGNSGLILGQAGEPRIAGLRLRARF